MRLNSASRLAARVFLLLVLARPTDAPAFASESESLFKALGLKAGLRVADVGAGDGEWAERIAREVGETGHVFATEVDKAEIEKIEKRIKDAGLANVTAVLGTQQDTGLAAACCDAILLRLVYHHFAEPEKMRASLRDALRPDAVLAVVDTSPQKSWRKLEAVPDRGGHGIREEDLVREMTGDGFEVVARHEKWNGDDDRYCVVFRRARARSFPAPPSRRSTPLDNIGLLSHSHLSEETMIESRWAGRP
jgi:tRNA A58 N-methylase Trm61